MLKRLKLIGIFFGKDLEKFIEAISGDRQQTTVTDESDSGEMRRVLELSLSKNQQSSVEFCSKFYKNKFNRYKISLFYESAYMVKSIIYDISWLLKLMSLILFCSMASRNKVSVAIIKFIDFQRNIHLFVMLVTMMDIYFYGARILLHRRLDTTSFVIKAQAGINMSLMTLDLLNAFCTITAMKTNGNGEKDRNGGDLDIEMILTGRESSRKK